jgi:hypothetical protein
MTPRYYRLKPDHSVELVDVRDNAALLAWATDVWGDGNRRRVALTVVAPGVSVSTVFLGLDHNFGGGRPLLFETMVFDDYADGDAWRWSTWDEAAVGHEAAVAMLRARLAAREPMLPGRVKIRNADKRKPD